MYVEEELSNFAVPQFLHLQVRGAIYIKESWKDQWKHIKSIDAWVSVKNYCDYWLFHKNFQE